MQAASSNYCRSPIAVHFSSSDVTALRMRKSEGPADQRPELSRRPYAGAGHPHAHFRRSRSVERDRRYRAAGVDCRRGTRKPVSIGGDEWCRWTLVGGIGLIRCVTARRNT